MKHTRLPRWLLACLAVFAVATGCSAPSRPASTVRIIDGSGIERYWEIQDRLMRGEPIEDAAWAALFATPAYLWQASESDAQTRIRGRMQLAFQPDRAPLESMLAGAEGYEAIRWDRHQRIRDEREVYGEFYDSLMSSNIVDEALAIAQEHLPPGTVNEEEWSTPVWLLFFAPDAFSIDGAVVMDLVEAFDQGEKLNLLLAHEFHHEVYSRLDTLPELGAEHPYRWVLQALRQLHMEGLADRIDKRGYPIPDREGGYPGYVEDFNGHYRNAGQTLARFDEALERVPGSADRGAAARVAWKLLHYAGHVEGFFMANTVAEAQGASALLIDIGDPFAFLRRFQSVRPTFSAETLAFLDAVEDELRAEGAPADN